VKAAAPRLAGCSASSQDRAKRPSFGISDYIAHVCESDGRIQTVEQHLGETGELAGLFTSAIGLPLCGRLLGLCHDLGKYSAAYQHYIRGITDLSGEDARIIAEAAQGTIDHASSGAQHVWSALSSKGTAANLLAQILSVALMSHHSRTGMKDFISLEGKSPFLDRLRRHEAKTFRQECVEKADPVILSEIDRLLGSSSLLEEFKTVASHLKASTNGKTTRLIAFSLLTRFLFSCLLDADRLSTANFEKVRDARFRTTGYIPNWPSLVAKLEDHLSGLETPSSINEIRRQVSDECRDAASRAGNLFTLPVPTGGGKTLASLRFALHRAAETGTDSLIERIIYVIPYTSIIDQNANSVRQILGAENVLEHHSNLTPENDTWRSRVLSENWDAPVVFTTSVQFFDSLFAQGTRTARRMHQLANSILIFDEIQTLPIKTIHAFNNSINFLTTFANTTVLLCTATMPLLHRVNPSLGALTLLPECEIITDKRALFEKLKRTEIVDKRRTKPWAHDEIVDFALECASLHRSTLVVCNTKDSARRLFEMLRAHPGSPGVIHLSTSMCPAHRKKLIDQLKDSLLPTPANSLICISTQLIEAGVDLDFGCVIRSLAGMDSIVQAGGRCNRHNERPVGYVYILNFGEEMLGKALADISNGQQITERVLGEFRDAPDSLDNDLLSEATMNRFYEYHFFQRAAEMLYPLPAGKGTPPIATKTSMLSLLSENQPARKAAERERSTEALELQLQQAFSTAAQAFRVIDAPTRGIIVPYSEGVQIIADLSAAFANEGHPLREQVRLLKRAQQYTVNVFPHIVDKLAKQDAIREVQGGSGIFYLDERYYHADLGVTLEALSEQHYLQV
jgi:CRISPR-associated endonuclease/helicase Cas3